MEIKIIEAYEGDCSGQPHRHLFTYGYCDGESLSAEELDSIIPQLGSSYNSEVVVAFKGQQTTATRSVEV
jgi:hypothetical protein